VVGTTIQANSQGHDSFTAETALGRKRISLSISEPTHYGDINLQKYAIALNPSPAVFLVSIITCGICTARFICKLPAMADQKASKFYPTEDEAQLKKVRSSGAYRVACQADYEHVY
jgi:hypothetical protein